MTDKTEVARDAQTRTAAPGPRTIPPLKSYRFPAGGDIREDIKSKYGFEGDLLDIYVKNRGRPVHKWHHFLPLYDRYLARLRGRAPRFLEIGVAGGGSLQMWRQYFGPEAIIFGVDIDPDCAAFDGESGQVRIGSQDDPRFLQEVVAEMGRIDAVLDDGSHRMDHIVTSFRTLFPLLAEDGVYLVEDLHTAYKRGFGGGLDQPGNFFHTIRRLTDDMHRAYHRGAVNFPDTADWITGLHVHDSLAVIEKGRCYPPTQSVVR